MSGDRAHYARAREARSWIREVAPPRCSRTVSRDGRSMVSRSAPDFGFGVICTIHERSFARMMRARDVDDDVGDKVGQLRHSLLRNSGTSGQGGEQRRLDLDGPEASSMMRNRAHYA